MGKEYLDAIDMFVDSRRVFPGVLKNDLSIVCHGSGSPIIPTAVELAQYFATNSDMVSSHFIVDRTGIVVQCVSLLDGAGGNCCATLGHNTYWDPYLQKYGNLNFCTISIEHCNDETNSLPLTPQQYRASLKLINWLCSKFGIAPARIQTHASIDPINRAHCPGALFPLQQLRQGATMSGLPKHAHDDGQTITFDDTSYVITHGFRQVYLNLADAGLIPGDDEPINNEYSCNPVEASHPDFWGGAGTAQETRYFRFGYSAKVGAVLTYVGQELAYLRSQINKTEPLPDVVKQDIATLVQDEQVIDTAVAQVVQDTGMGTASPQAI